MLRANDIKMLPVIAVMIPINDDHRCSSDLPSLTKCKESKSAITIIGLNAAAGETVVIALVIVGVG